MTDPSYKDFLISYILKYDWAEFSKDNPVSLRYRRKK